MKTSLHLPLEHNFNARRPSADHGHRCSNDASRNTPSAVTKLALEFLPNGHRRSIRWSRRDVRRDCGRYFRVGRSTLVWEHLGRAVDDITDHLHHCRSLILRYSGAGSPRSFANSPAANTTTLAEISHLL